MSINWDIVTKIVVPLFTLGLGKYLDRWFERKPRLIYYLGHASAFTVRGNPDVAVHTHAVVIRNAGRKAATNIRIGHNILPENFQLYPPVSHEVIRDNSGAAEIVIPKLVQDEQVTISYLYFPPLLWNQINSYAKSDEGLAKAINAIPTPQPPKWLNRIIQVLIFTGVTALLYVLTLAILALLRD